MSCDEEGTGQPGATVESDRELLRRFRRGEEDAATALYLRYAQRLQRLVRSKSSERLASRLDPEDIVQSVFRSFFRRAADGQYEVPAGDELWQLLLVISLNKLRNQGSFHHAHKRDVRRTVSATTSQLDREIARVSSMQALQSVIEEAVEALPETQKAMVVLRIQGYELLEIATQVGRSLRTVERVLQGFRERLRLAIEKDDARDGG